jgi:membrane-associated phospholipid phosphatase
MNSRELDHADPFQIKQKTWVWIAVYTAFLPLIFLEDEPIRFLVNHYRVEPVFRLMHILTWLGLGSVLSVVAIVLFGIGWRWSEKKFKQAGALGLISLAISGVVVQVVKHLTGRPRPKLTDQGIVEWGPSFQSGHDSFPSGHAFSAFALAAVLSSFFPKGRWVWYSLAVLVAVTRVYINAHFASDVFVGAFLGILTGIWASRLKLEYLKS